MLFKHALAVGLAIIAISLLMILSVSLTLSHRFSVPPNSYSEQGQERPSILDAEVPSYQTIKSNIVISNPPEHVLVPSTAQVPPSRAVKPSIRTPQSIPSPPLVPSTSSSLPSSSPPSETPMLAHCQKLELEYGISDNDWGRLPIMMQAEYKQSSCTGGMQSNTDMEPPQISFTQVRPSCQSRRWTG